MKSGIKTLAVITGPYTTAKLGAAITLASTAFGWALAYVAARSMLREIIQKARERGVPVVKVNPRGAPSLCPRCGKKLVRGNAPETPPLPQLRVERGEGRTRGILDTHEGVGEEKVPRRRDGRQTVVCIYTKKLNKRVLRIE
ncbi:zinc ribbon domain-containing protein [Pyrobaculum islandicum]|uniref:zinc ribbon domain-containing protein n=1 Tax=Pyrobaculum islandicum TaxID=2277 RepID=UPI00069F4FAC|nr:zinc ribbon domain-containing protein [Pyrobaculum islandicum]